jgi:outer membrane protein assembly factor BamA
MLSLFRFFVAFTLFYQLKAQVVLAPMNQSPWPKRAFALKDSSEAQHKINQHLRQLHQKGHVLASIDSIRFMGDTLFVQLFSGQKWKWIVLEPESNSIHSKSEPQKLKPEIWDVLKEKKLKELLEQGFAEAKVLFRPFHGSDSSGLFIIEAYIVPGSALRYDSVKSNPNTVVAPMVLQHLSGVYPDKPVQRKRIEEGSRALASVGLLAPNAFAKITQRGRKVDVEWPLQKAKTNRFSGILGLMPENNQTGGFLFTGELDLALENILGYTEQLSLTWQRLQTSTQQLNVQAAWPYLLGSRFGWIGQFNMFRIDSAFSQINGKTGLSWKPSGLDLLAGFVKIRQSSVAPGAENPSLGWLEASAVSAGIQWQHRYIDDPITPKKGQHINLTASTGERTYRSDTIGGPNNGLVFEAEAEASIIRPLHRRWVYFLRLHGWWLSSPNLLMSETRRLGGLHTLRGVDEESLYATWFAYGNTEIRYLFDRGSWFQFFIDGGKFGLNLTQKTRSQWQLGIGGGLTFLTPAGSFSVVYALGLIPGESANFGQSKIHIGYQARW